MPPIIPISPEPLRPGALRWALAVVSLSTAWVCLALENFAQEAYYWSYAQHLDLSYFDHPPMVAWGIAAGTGLLGDGSLGIRLATWLAAMVTTLAGLSLLRDFRVDRPGQMVWVVGNIAVPALAITHVLANPDAPLTAFWVLCLLGLWGARDGNPGWWIAAGAAAGAALLSKYTAAFLAVGGVLVLVFDPALRRQWRRPGPYLALATAVLVFAPVLWWNLEHEFASFRFQTSNRFRHAAASLHWLPQCLGGQLAMVHPVFALLVPVVGLWLWRRARKGDPRSLWLIAFGAPLPGYLLVNSIWIQIKINWFTPAYAVLLLGAAVWWGESGWMAIRPRWRTVVRRSAWVMAGLVLAAPMLRFVPPFRAFPWSGWGELAERVEHWEDMVDSEDAIEGNVFFFASGYKTAAQLALHLRLQATAHHEPGEVLEPILAQNVLGETALQFDYWDAPCARVGQDAILVVDQPEQQGSVVVAARRRFHHILRVERVRITRLGIPILEADIYACRGYRGPVLALPDEAEPEPVK